MSANNGVIRIGRKGTKQFAFGDDAPFKVDVVIAWQEWIEIDDGFRPDNEDGKGNRSIPLEQVPNYHQAAISFVDRLRSPEQSQTKRDSITVAEALDFLARLREQYDELAVFFRPKSQEKPVSQDTSEAELRFSTEAT